MQNIKSLFPNSKNQTYLSSLLKKHWNSNDISNKLIDDVLGINGAKKWY